MSQDIRDEARVRAGMREKAMEFRETGGEIYVPNGPVREDAEGFQWYEFLSLQLVR